MNSTAQGVTESTEKVPRCRKISGGYNFDAIIAAMETGLGYISMKIRECSGSLIM